MSLDLGTLSAKVKIDTSGVSSSLGAVKRDLTDVKKGMDDAGKSGENLDINKNAAGNVAKTAQEARKLGDDLDGAGKSGKDLKVSEQPATELDRASKSAKSLGDRLGDAAGKVAKWTAAAAGTAVIGTVGASIAKGFSRLNSIDQATAKLEALGNSGTQVEAIMDNALASVKGTAFGIGEAAGTAATMVASGVKPGQELEAVLTGVADSAAIGGVSMEEMGLIWGKVAAKGKLDGETMAQMLERQLPIYDILSEKLGVASEDIADMVSEGKVSFEDFSSAMNDYVGGGAVRMGETVSGAWDNVGAAAGRFGAELAKPIFEAAPGLMSTITEQIDGATEAVGPLAAEFADRFVPALSTAVEGVIPAAINVIGGLGDAFNTAMPFIKGTGEVLSNIPFPIIAAGIAGITAKQTGLTGALEAGTGKAKSYAGMVGNTLGGVLINAGNAYRRGSDGLKVMADGHFRAGRQAQQQSIVTKDAFTSIDYMGQSLGRNFAGHMTSMAGSAKGFATGGLSVVRDAMGGVKRAGEGLITALGGPWGLAIAGATTVISLLAAQHRDAKQAEEEHAAAQDALRDTLDKTTGAISEQTRELQARTLQESGAIDTARELGVAQNTVVDAAMGNAEAQREVEAAIRVANVEAVKSSETWQKNREEFEANGVSAEDLADAFMGVEGAGKRVRDASTGMMTEFIGVKRDVEGATEGVDEFGDAVFGAADNLEEMEAEAAAIALENFEGNARRTAEAVGLLGDSIKEIPDDKTIIVDSMAPTVRQEMKDLGLEVEDLPDGTVKVTFPDSVNVLETLRQMDVSIRQLPDGRITLEDNTPEVQQRMIDLGFAVRDEKTGEVRINDNIADVIGRQVELGAAVTDEHGNVYINDNISEVMALLGALDVETTTLPHGHVHVTDDTDENRANLDELGIQTTTLPGGHIAITDTSPDNLANLANLGTTTEALPPGHIQVTDTSAENIKRLNDVGVTTTTLPDGRVIIRDNATQTANHIKTTLSRENTNTFSDHVINITRRIRDVFTSDNADGNVYATVKAFAGGGVERAVNKAMSGNHVEPPHSAHIAPAGTYRVFAESETGGEAYIPLAESKRPRSERILAQVASKFGYQLADQEGRVRAFANGGVVDSIVGLVNRHFPEMSITSTHRAGDPGYHGRGMAVDVSNGTDVTPEMDNLAKWFNQNFRSQLAELIHWGPYNVKDGRSVGDGVGFYGMGTMQGHRNHVHLAAERPLRNPVPVGNAGLSDLNELEGAVGVPSAPGQAYPPGQDMPATHYDRITPPGTRQPVSRSGYGSNPYEYYEEPDRVLHGGAGTLFRDGSFLELMAAIYSKQTGQPMDDDIVSWGQVVGLHSKVAERDAQERAREAEKLYDSIASTTDKLEDRKVDLPTAEEELRIAKLKRDEVYNKRDKDGNLNATEVQKTQADQSVAKAEQKVADLKAEIAEMEAEVSTLESEMQAFSIYDGLLAPTEGIGGTSGNRYADEIIKEGKRRGITDRGIKIALATALVESDMKMYANPADPDSFNYPHDAVGSDHDSVGLFQQRANGAWGTTADRMDPARSAGMFYDKLVERDYNQGDPGAHAQRVQVSAFPGRYSTRMGEADQILSRYYANPGNLTVTPMADGGILGNARSAQIRENSAVLWAEAGPEAYIPLSPEKRDASLQIWAETGKRLGVDVMSLLNLIGSGLPGLVEGRLDFSTGRSTSLEALGLNREAASYRGGQAISNAVGAVFNGPVQVNDPQQYLRGQLGNAEKMLGDAMRSFGL